MIAADLFLPAIQATSKRQAFRGIAEEAAGLLSVDAEDILTALLERERIGPTGIGFGTAVPHVKISGIDRLYGVVACLANPVEYEAVDDVPVDIIFMLLAPADSKTTQHLKSLAMVARFLRDQNNCLQLRAAKSPDEMQELLTQWVSAQLRIE